MDKNKLEKLRGINYTIRKTCGICRYGQFSNSNWGTCSKYTYDHQKHTGAARHLSIYVSGKCEDGFESSELETGQAALGAFQEFMEKE